MKYESNYHWHCGTGWLVSCGFVARRKMYPRSLGIIWMNYSFPFKVDFCCVSLNVLQLLVQSWWVVLCGHLVLSLYLSSESGKSCVSSLLHIAKCTTLSGTFRMTPLCNSKSDFVAYRKMCQRFWSNGKVVFPLFYLSSEYSSPLWVLLHIAKSMPGAGIVRTRYSSSLFYSKSILLLVTKCITLLV